MDQETVTQHPSLNRACVECNYVLEGLPETGRCPECGLEYGKELVLVGYKSIPIDKPTAILGTIILFGSGFAMFFTGNPGKGGAVIGLGIWFLFSNVLVRRHHDTIGGNLRWIVNHEGIRAIRGEASQIPLLPWSQIRTISTRGTIGSPAFRKHNWRTLIARRKIFSLDWIHTRGQQIWLENLDSNSMKELRDKVRSYRT